MIDIPLLADTQLQDTVSSSDSGVAAAEQLTVVTSTTADIGKTAAGGKKRKSFGTTPELDSTEDHKSR